MRSWFSTTEVAAVPPGAELEGRAEGAIRALDRGTIEMARWSGLAGASVRAVSLAEAFALADGTGIAIARVEVADARVAPLFAIPLEGGAPWRALDRLIRMGQSRDGLRGGRLIGLPAASESSGGRFDEDHEPTAAGVRAMPGDQSHTSVVLDDAWVLKLYRRLTLGANPEAEMIEALANVPGAPIPVWGGAAMVTLPDGAIMVLAIRQSFVPGAVDAFELIAEELAAWLPRPAAGSRLPSRGLDVIEATGRATGALHRALAAVPGPGFGRRRSGADDLQGRHLAALARIDAARAALATVAPALRQAIIGANEEIVAALVPLARSSEADQLQRIHGDLHLGQILPQADAVVLIDFEGDPTRPVETRAGLDLPLRDVATFLRSIDHVARSGARRAAHGAPGPIDPEPNSLIERRLAGWIKAARSRFLSGYAAGIGDDAWRPDGPLLRALEVEKELAEFVYAATFLPPWLYAPDGGMRALLGASWATGMATSDRAVTRGGAAGDTMDGDTVAGDTMDGDKVAGDTATGR